MDKVYLEITNVCNFDCSFCHKTERKKKFMSEEEFDLLTDKLRGKAKYLYFHLMGEPTIHPSLPLFIKQAHEKGFLPSVTTNGSTLSRVGSVLLDAKPYKVNISLHAPEANPAFNAEGYFEGCIDFAKKAASRGTIAVLRLWNLGSDADNSEILDKLHMAFPEPWKDIRGGASHRLSERIFLEWGERFDWPDASLAECELNADCFCYGLRDQIGVLVDGTAVPCCLDADGEISLGNLFDSELDEILSSPRAMAIYDGFSRRRAVEPLCRKCGYAKRFSR